MPIPSPFSPSPFHFKSAGGGRTKGYTVSRRIPFEPPLIKLKSAGNDLSSLIFLTEGDEPLPLVKAFISVFRVYYYDLQNTESERKKGD